MKKSLAPFLLLLSFAISVHAQSIPSPGACESLAKLSLPQAKILGAETVPSGTFKSPTPLPPWLPDPSALYKSLPTFCRVIVQATPSADSDIRIEIWLPTKGWNLKFQAHGNGGFAGEIDYFHLASSLRSGYATANTDTGHSAQGTDASWALGHPEKVTDYGYRAVHIMTVLAKEVIRKYYLSGPLTSYFLGCSNGGRQALMEAQRFPEDYNGILAGAPANYWTHLLTSGLWNMQATTNDDASYIPASKLPAIAHAVNAACDAEDGVPDGILNDPRKCNFQPETMLCVNSDAEGCLTAPQIAALRKIYEGPHDAKHGKIFPGFLPGAEEGPGGWSTWITGTQPGKSLIAAFTYGYFANIIYEKKDWNYKTADLADAVQRADEKTGKILNATDADLEPFRKHGGKLIMYHGWNDPAISALNTIDYFQSVRDKLGAEQTESFLRLYMLPGVQHCGGGPGADSFGTDSVGPPQVAQHNILRLLEYWVENEITPPTVIASKYSGDPSPKDAKFTRPLCPYPQSAKYKGSDDPNDASNFTCSTGE